MRSPRARHLLVLAITLPGVAAGLVTMAPASSADDVCFTFSALAASDGVRVSAFSPGEFIVEGADIQGPAAQATANSLGQSIGYAGAPYPGDAALSAVALGGADPSTIPSYVTSQYPTMRKGERSTPAITLLSASEETWTTATAKGGGGSGDGSVEAGTNTSSARAGCDPKNGVTAGDAISDTQALSFAAGTLRLGRVQSEAHAVIGKDGKPQLRSSLTVGQVTVAGQTVGFTDKGLVYPGGSQALPANPLSDALTSAGVKVAYIAGDEDKDRKGITAPGVEVEVTRAITGTGPTVVTYTFGRARARVSGDAGSSLGPPAAGGGGGLAVVGGSSAGNAPEMPALSAGTDAAQLNPGLSSAPSLAAPSTGSDVPSPATARSNDSPQQQLAQRAQIRPLHLPLAGIYLALVVGAAAVLGGGSLIRLIGVRLAWM